MLKQIARFLTYNNAVPLFLGVIFLGTTGAFAATQEGRDAVFSQQQQVVSIDNSRIVNVDLSSFPFTVEVTGVREDTDSYYVDYSFHTVDLVNGAWQDVTQGKMLTVAKDALKGSDLGLYATKEIAEVRSAEKQRLIETQKIERSHGETSKVLATEYGGLIGKFLDPTTETLPGYTPVVTPPSSPVQQVAVGVAAEAQPVSSNPGSSAEPASDASAQQGIVAGASTHLSGDPTDTVPPTIMILGNNPARITKGSSYADLGVLVTDDQMLNIGYSTLLDGVSVATINIDTSAPRTYVVTYRAADQAGNTTEASRTIEVYDPFAQASTSTSSPIK